MESRLGELEHMVFKRIYLTLYKMRFSIICGGHTGLKITIMHGEVGLSIFELS